jgi:hypothetical protein
MHFLVTRSPRTTFATIACDVVADPFEAGQLFGVDMDHVARLLLLVALQRGLGFQAPQTDNAHGFHRPRHGRQRRATDLGNPPDGAALVPEIHRVLQLQRTESAPLGTVNAASIRKGRCTA